MDPVNQNNSKRPFTDLHFAAFIGDHEKMEKLFREGADPTVKDSLGKTPIDCAIDFYKRHHTTPPAQPMPNLLKRTLSGLWKGYLFFI